MTGAADAITAKLTKQNAPISAIDGLTLTAASIGNITGVAAGLAGLTQAAGIVGSTFTATPRLPG